MLCSLSYFYLYEHDGSEELVTVSDLALKTIVWGSVCAYLHSKAQESNFPGFLRIWWWIYAFVSSCCLVIDFVIYGRHVFLPIMSLFHLYIVVFNFCHFCLKLF